MKHTGTQTIVTPRLTLRRFLGGDAEQMFKNWTNDSRVAKYVTWQPHGNIENTKALLKMWIDGYKDDNFYNWAIEYDNEIIGNISAVEMNDKLECATIGYCMGFDYWNKGIMTEALGAVIRYLFDTVGVHRIQSEHDTMNPASGKVMSKCGMIYEGTKRKMIKNHDGELIDLAQYAILSDDYNKCEKSVLDKAKN